jgi:hypothetical protein
MRLIRLLVPLSLYALVTSALVVACGTRRGESPGLAPRPDILAPNGLPARGPSAGISESDRPIDGYLYAEPATSQAASVVSPAEYSGHRPSAVVLAASQPGAPSQPSAPAQPGAPSQPGPGGTSQPTPGAPAQPGPGGTSQPAPSAPRQPGSGAPPPGPGPTAPPPAPAAPQPRPGTSQPGDAGVSDGALPLPPIPDGGVPADAGLEPILRK